MIWLLLAGAVAWWWWSSQRPKPRRDEQAARAVLGVSADAGPDAIRAAHRRLVAGVHPDRGGSAELTRRVNAARDTLLRAAERDA